jgi:hypothetical protein
MSEFDLSVTRFMDHVLESILRKSGADRGGESNFLNETHSLIMVTIQLSYFSISLGFF